MKKTKHIMHQIFMSKDLDFRVRLFNILALAGFATGLIMATMSFAIGASIATVILCLASAVLSIVLLIYSYKSGKYRQCYIITIIAIFLFLFTAMFFTGGGFHGGMPSFFIFAIVFTVFMLDGIMALVLSLIELITYIGICIFSYYRPDTITFFETELDILFDVIFAFTVVSVGLGVTMFLHFRLYNKQQRELEFAREEAVKFSEAKSRFLANTSHEIRTPINVILGMNEMMLRESTSSSISEYASTLQNAGDTLLALIDDILDVSQIEANKFRIKEAPYLTSELISDIASIGNESIGGRDIEFKLEYSSDIPTELLGDYTRIKQVATNFLSNAAKYTMSGSVTLKFDWLDSSLVVSVADTGIGISEEDIPTLFDSFIRVNVSSSEYIRGTGLGLSIAKQLTELMRGEIGLTTELGVGSVFTATIPQEIINPVTIGECGELSSQSHKRRESGFIAPGARVLVVDDNNANILVVKSLLRRTMIKLDSAKSGRECIELAMKNHYDVIMIDYMMPELNGKQTLQELQKLPEFSTPTIVLTANVVTAVKSELLAAGFSRYISKPILWNELEHALMELLPTELIIMSGDNESSILSENEYSRLRDLLRKYAVEMDDGLRYLGGDIVQYTAMADIFISSYNDTLRELNDCAHSANWAKMAFGVHALSSKAKALGANALSQTSHRLEALCSAENSDGHILASLPLLRFELEQANEGLGLFVNEMAANLPAEPTEETETNIEALLALLRHNQHYDAMNMLRALSNSVENPKDKALLMRVMDLTASMDYKQAALALENRSRGEV